MPEKQAEVQAETFAEIIEERIATKRDLKELEIALKQDIHNFNRDMKEMEQRIIIKLGAMLAASIVIMGALIKLL